MQPDVTLGLVLEKIGVFIALPILVMVAWNVWLSYIQTTFLRNIKWTLLEIKPPRDVYKSPLAMELVLNSLAQAGGTGNWVDKYWKGNLRNYFSLEIVSLEGSLRFFIRTNDKFRKIIESQIYAQYPQAQVLEVEDYMKAIPEYTKDGPINLFGTNMILSKEDAYPIKTYVDYGLDRAIGSLDEEQRIDPITPTLEMMGSMGQGERMMIQIIVRAATDRFTIKSKKDGVEVEEKGKKWTDAAKAIIKKMNEDLKEKDKEGKVTAVNRMTKGQQQVIDSIERNAEKIGFDAGVRMVYVANKDKFDANRIAGLMGLLRQFNSNDSNSFKPDGATDTGLAWNDLFKTKIVKMKKDMLADYRDRGYFYGGFEFDKVSKYFTHPNESGGKPFILTTEELATLFHLPGRVAETPSFTRIDVAKAEPPANLPI